MVNTVKKIKKKLKCDFLFPNPETINTLKRFARLYGPVAKFRLFYEEFIVLNSAETAQVNSY